MGAVGGGWWVVLGHEEVFFRASEAWRGPAAAVGGAEKEVGEPCRRGRSSCASQVPFSSSKQM